MGESQGRHARVALRLAPPSLIRDREKHHPLAPLHHHHEHDKFLTARSPASSLTALSSFLSLPSIHLPLLHHPLLDSSLFRPQSGHAQTFPTVLSPLIQQHTEQAPLLATPDSLHSCSTLLSPVHRQTRGEWIISHPYIAVYFKSCGVSQSCLSRRLQHQPRSRPLALSRFFCTSCAAVVSSRWPSSSTTIVLSISPPFIRRILLVHSLLKTLARRT